MSDPTKDIADFWNKVADEKGLRTKFATLRDAADMLAITHADLQTALLTWIMGLADMDDKEVFDTANELLEDAKKAEEHYKEVRNGE